MSHETTSVCLLVGSETVPNWFADAIRVVGDTEGISIPLIVVTQRTKSSDEDDEIKQRGRFERLKRQLFTPSFLNRDPVEHVSLQELEVLSDAERIVTDLEPADGLGVKIPAATVDRIADCCDIVVHNGVGILKGRILTQPQHGVLSYHHGDIRSYRGGAPAGFWQHLNDEEYVGVTLQRLNEQLDAGEIASFSEIFIGDADTWYEVQKRMYSASVPMLKEGIETLADPETEPTTVPESDLGKVYYRSDWTVWARLRSRLKDFIQSYSP